jgi:hypothetical protein
MGDYESIKSVISSHFQLAPIAQAPPQWDDTWQPKGTTRMGLLRDLVFLRRVEPAWRIAAVGLLRGEIHPAGTAKVA